VRALLLVAVAALAVAVAIVATPSGGAPEGRVAEEFLSTTEAEPPAEPAEPAEPEPAVTTAPAPPPPSPPAPRIRWRDSRALGLPHSGRLVNGVRVPAQGRHFFTWDPVLRRAPNRPWRRWGTDGVVRITLRVLRDHRTAHPDAPRVGIGDLSRRRGGDFGPRFGGIGHVSHQNGLDVDVYYPRKDARERSPKTVRQVDRRLSQDLVDRFVAAGAERIFVGPNVRLTGPPGIVQVLTHHDNHLHVRIPRRRA
jgi:Penicillin-insensitive murein endopeptidase